MKSYKKEQKITTVKMKSNP